MIKSYRSVDRYEFWTRVIFDISEIGTLSRSWFFSIFYYYYYKLINYYYYYFNTLSYKKQSIVRLGNHYQAFMPHLFCLYANQPVNYTHGPECTPEHQQNMMYQTVDSWAVDSAMTSWHCIRLAGEKEQGTKFSIFIHLFIIFYCSHYKVVSYHKCVEYAFLIILNLPSSLTSSSIILTQVGALELWTFTNSSNKLFNEI